MKPSPAPTSSTILLAGSAAAAACATAVVLLRKVFAKKAVSIIPPGQEDPTIHPTTHSKDHHDNDDYYDIIIVGAGPAGSTASYYLGHAQKGLKILLRERKAFPRVKYCGDAWCSQALDILEDMQYRDDDNNNNTGGQVKPILRYLEDTHQCRPVQRGGFVSPFGYQCINMGDQTYGSVAQVRTYAMKRVIVDEIMARAAAQQSGVTLRENANVQVDQVQFNTTEKYWTVPIQQQQQGNGNTTTTKTNIVRGKVLVAADGATSYLARHLNLVTQDADVVCSHRYVVGKADQPGAKQHNFTADGVMFFNKSVLPGYSALFKHCNNDTYLGTYILPGGKATSRCIAGFEQELVNRHPYVRAAFGGGGKEDAKDESSSQEDVYAKTQWRNDLSQGENGKIKTAPIRCGGEEKTYGDHLIVIGDAAGQVDPMTGEGIHTAMVAAKISAETILEMFEARNFSEEATCIYHQRWRNAFGKDFPWSALGAKLIYQFPILLDAACAYGQECGGQTFLDEFGLIMTGVKPKSDFLQLKLALPVALYLMREIVVQKFLRRPPLIPQDIGQALVDKHYQASQKQKSASKLNPQ